jgi:hypothetical protein
MIIHQGIINSYNAMFSQGIIIAFPGPDIMSISKALKKIMKDVGTGGNDHINQFHLDHIADHLAHPARDHRPGQPHEDDAGRIVEHLSKNFKTFKDISALKRGVLEGFYQIEKAFRPSEV